MKKKILLVFVTAAILLTLVLTGCSGGGISQADYDDVKAQLADTQSKLTKALADLAAAQSSSSSAELEAAQAQIAALQKQVTDLQAKYEPKDSTLAEIAARIIKTYTDTHVYSKTDMFICGDMSSEVWNMLKAQGISSVIVIGNKDAQVTDILQSNHAWVLADVGNGEKLALETTAGYAVTRTENANYYFGWSFSSPTDLKSNNDWIKEHNTRVEFRNLLAAEVNDAMGLYNNSSSQAEADKYLELYNKLKELKDEQETKILELKAKIDGLAKQL